MRIGCGACSLHARVRARAAIDLTPFLRQTGIHFAGKLHRMRLVVISIGRLKQGPERELAERYRERFDDIGRKLGFRGLEIHEIPESRARDAATRIAEEAAAITALIPEKYVLVALDERGKNIDSAAFARPSRPLAGRIGCQHNFHNRRRGRTFARFAAQG